MPYYSVLLTRDTTESARLCVEADDRDHAHEVARDHVTEDQWCLDGENYRRKADYYLGDPLNAIEEIGAAEFQAFRSLWRAGRGGGRNGPRLCNRASGETISAPALSASCVERLLGERCIIK